MPAISSFEESPEPIATPWVDPMLFGALHFELFTTTKSRETVRVPCWCAVDGDHTYLEWEVAGRPDVFGGVAERAGAVTLDG